MAKVLDKEDRKVVDEVVRVITDKMLERVDEENTAQYLFDNIFEEACDEEKVGELTRDRIYDVVYNEIDFEDIADTIRDGEDMENDPLGFIGMCEKDFL